MKKSSKQYMITPVFNERARKELLAAHPNMTNTEYRAAITAAETRILKDMRAPVSDIVARHGGEMVSDGSGYGVEGHKYCHSKYMIVKVPDAAVAELEKVSDTRVTRFENSTFRLPKTF